MSFSFHMKCMKNMNIGGRNALAYTCLRLLTSNLELTFFNQFNLLAKKENFYIQAIRILTTKDCFSYIS